ncbi:Hypothetical protein POVR1_LOCUS82 [uncultured virus]|nr:Hypothetical protein POVR1_LOCUS82 [uncultured virus]
MIEFFYLTSDRIFQDQLGGKYYDENSCEKTLSLIMLASDVILTLDQVLNVGFKGSLSSYEIFLMID